MLLTKAECVLVGQLTHAALDRLWYASPGSLPENPTPEDIEDHSGCCPICCAPCGALKALLDNGTLEEWLLAWPGGHIEGCYYWDIKNNRVDRDFLAQAWGSPCPNAEFHAEIRAAGAAAP